MKYEIKNLVDEVFRGAPESKKAAELKEEIYQNLSDRYDELVHGGKSDREAMEAIKSAMGDFTPLIAALGENNCNGEYKNDKDNNSSENDARDAGGVSGKDGPVNVNASGGADAGKAGSKQKRAEDGGLGASCGRDNSRNEKRKKMSGVSMAWIIALSVIFGLIIITFIYNMIVHSVINSLSNYYISADELYSIGGGSISADGIDGVSIKWIAGNVDIRCVEGNTVNISEKSDHTISSDMQLRYRVKDGRLEIVYGRSRNIFFGFWGRDYSKDLTIELPYGMSGVLKNVEIETVGANVKIDGKTGGSSETAGTAVTDALLEISLVKVDTVSGNILIDMISASDCIKIQTVSGQICISFSKTPDLDIGTVSGEVYFKGQADDISYNSVSGNLELHIPLPRSVKANTTSGKVRIIMPSAEISGFTADFDSVSGSLRSGYPTTVNGKRYVNGDGASLIDFDSVSGGLVIDYEGSASGN
jgi:hypothetical protein